MTDEGSENNDFSIIQKYLFPAQPVSKDGRVLQIHHSIPESKGPSLRFTAASFDLTGERVAVSDPLGNAYIVDLQSNRFWKLPVVPGCYLLTYSHYLPRKQDLLFARVCGPLHFINAESGEIICDLLGHKKAPLSASFAENEPFCVSVCSSSAIIWDLRSNSLLHQLMLRSSIGIKQVRFMPTSNNIFGLFDDSTVHVWRLDDLEFVKEILPEECGGPNIKTIAFTRNGRGLVVGGQTATLAVFLVDSWTLQKLIALPENCKAVKHLEFVPQLFDGGANKVLAILTSTCSMMFVDTETDVLLKIVEHLAGCVSGLEVSLSGKYVALVMRTGEVNVYSSSQLIYGGNTYALMSETKAPPPTTQAPLPTSMQAEVSRRDLALIDKQVCDLIDLKHLRPILKEFGEYPASYRSLIWKSILCLPENQGAFVALINKGVHPAFTLLDKAFPLTNRSTLSTVKRLVSCLAYWSPIFIRVKYLPIFILPFTRVIKHDQFSCFESVATIIVNWCQGWFDFVPYPPLSVLEQVKKLLMLHNEELVNHYSNCNITSDLYIWSLLETGFYEVLGWSEWQQLWDHVLSNHPAFLLFLVVAFNITCHTALMCLQQTDDFEHFFHTEVVVNMSQLLSKAYQLWSDTPADSHPRSQLKSFKPLVKGNMYQMFTDYPKHLLDQQLEKLSNLYEEQEALDSQKLEINKQKLELDADQRHVEEARLKDARLKELEEVYKHTLRKEESHLDDQRRSITATRRDLREKEVLVRSQTLDKTLQDKATKYAQLEQLMEQIGEKKSTAEFQSSTSWGSSHQSTDPSLLRIQHASVVHHLSKLKRLYHQSNMTHPQLKHCINKFEDLLVRIETALELEQSTRQPRSCQSQQVLNLEEETQALEDEAQELLRRLSLSPEAPQNPICLKRGQSSCYCCGDSKKS